jgi:hypothetical protein
VSPQFAGTSVRAADPQLLRLSCDASLSALGGP